MIKGIKIVNFMGITDAEIDLTAPLNIFSGTNEAGKSSIRDALLWGFTGSARGLRTHNEQASLIKEGAKVAEVTVYLSDGHAFTRRKTAKTAAQVMGDVPEIGLSPAILFDPYTFLAMEESARRELLFKVIPGLHPTEQNVYERLIRWPAVEAIPYESTMEVSPNDIIKPIAKMAASHGFHGAEKECVAKRREAKRVRDEYKGATEPEKTLTIDGQTYDIPTLNLSAIEATLKELSKEKDDLLRQKGAGEARAKRLERVQNQLANLIIPPVPDPNELIALQAKQGDCAASLAQVEREIKQLESQLRPWEEFPAICPAITQQIPCPKAGERIGQDPPDAGILEAFHQNRTGLYSAAGKIEREIENYRGQFNEHWLAKDKEADLALELEALKDAPEATIDLDAEIATRQRRIDRGTAFDRAVHDYDLALGRYQDTLAKLAAAEQEVIIYDALAKALAPDGIPSQMIAEALDGINELLEDAAGYFFPGRYLHLTGDLGIVLQNSPYITLSKSAKYRVGVAFQFALARLTGARILLIDEADILDDDRRGDLIKFLLAKVSDFNQIMVFMTTAEPPKFSMGGGNLQTWWLENGTVTEVTP